MEFHFCGPTNLTFVCVCVFSGPFVPSIAGSKLRSIKDNCGPDYLNEKKKKNCEAIIHSLLQGSEISI